MRRIFYTAGPEAEVRIQRPAVLGFVECDTPLSQAGMYFLRRGRIANEGAGVFGGIITSGGHEYACSFSTERGLLSVFSAAGYGHCTAQDMRCLFDDFLDVTGGREVYDAELEAFMVREYEEKFSGEGFTLQPAA